MQRSSNATALTPRSYEESHRMHSVEYMIWLFMQIDADKNGRITRQELQDFYRKNGQDDRSVSGWMDRFDADNDGVITLEEFARGTGIPYNDLVKERNIRLREAKTRPAELADIEVISSSMSVSRENEIAEQFKSVIASRGRGDDADLDWVSGQLKGFLDTNYGPIWQCVCLTGRYGIRFTYEPFCNFQFRYRHYICLVWRTHRGV